MANLDKAGLVCAILVVATILLDWGLGVASILIAGLFVAVTLIGWVVYDRVSRTQYLIYSGAAVGLITLLAFFLRNKEQEISQEGKIVFFVIILYVIAFNPVVARRRLDRR